MASEDSYWQMAMRIRGNGSKIRRMVKGPICIPMELDMKVSGSKINNKASAARLGLMEVSTKVCITMVKNMAKENLPGKMEHLILGTGTSTRCTVRVFLGGQTAGATKGSIKTIGNTAKGSSSVLTENVRKGYGRMENKRKFYKQSPLITEMYKLTQTELRIIIQPRYIKILSIIKIR